MRLLAIIVAGLSLAAGVALAAQQLVPTKTLLVKNLPSGSRKVLLKVRETASAVTIVGDPTADGATLRIQLTPGGDQCVTMPAAGWSTVSTIGFKYKDTALANGPVKVAQIKKSPSGTFILKALLKNGGPTSIAVAPGNPTTSYATNFSLGTGDEYCSGTATATPNPNNATTFKVSNDGAPAGCVLSCLATTTTSSTSSTSTTAPLPPGPLCCAFGGPSCIGGIDATACLNAFGVPAAGGAVCDSTRTCVPPPGAPGDCCDNAPPPSQPNTCGAVDATTCASIGGTFHPASVCQPSGSCSP